MALAAASTDAAAAENYCLQACRAAETLWLAVAEACAVRNLQPAQQESFGDTAKSKVSKLKSKLAPKAATNKAGGSKAAVSTVVSTEDQSSKSTQEAQADDDLHSAPVSPKQPTASTAPSSASRSKNKLPKTLAQWLAFRPQSLWQSRSTSDQAAIMQLLQQHLREPALTAHLAMRLVEFAATSHAYADMAPLVHWWGWLGEGEC